MRKVRLDNLLFISGKFSSREAAKRAILAGLVEVDGKKAEKPGAMFQEDASIKVKELPRYVSRGGYKLEKAIAHFGLEIKGKACLDCGSSSGGFTDCLLQHGAKEVIAIDVGYGQMDWKLRQDDRVYLFERTNIRGVDVNALPYKAEFVTADLSFISIQLVFEKIREISGEEAEFLFLVKPQFEVGKGMVGKGGVVREQDKHIDLLRRVTRVFEESGFAVEITFSPIKGPKGNIEYLAWLKKSTDKKYNRKEKEYIEKVVSEAFLQLNNKK